MTSDWVVHKFGGSSLSDAAAFRHVAEILDDDGASRCAVVVSAMSGVTDALIRLVRLAGDRDESYRAELGRLKDRTLQVVGELLPGEPAAGLSASVLADLGDIQDLLRATWLMRSRPENLVDLVAGYGERWSAQLLAAHFRDSGKPATWLDAREVLIVSPGELAPAVDWDVTRRKTRAWIERSARDRVVITGFVATRSDGVPTTLGRNGSDYSASIFGALLDAASITIWTDVDGVMSANPRQVADALILDELSYDEAMELAYFGAKVIHPSTMAAAVARQIPIYIRNTFNPGAPGTKIHLRSSGGSPVRGFATIEDIALVNLEGSGMIGVPGIAERLFGALRQAGVSVVLISQGSSEHSICFAIPQDQADAACDAAERAFFAERHQGQIEAPEVARDCAILAVVGDNMAGIPGIAGKFFGALAKAGLNVRAIAQGSSERNISVVIDGRDSTRALRAVHSGFYLSNQTLSIGLIGPGLVGSALLGQLASQAERLRSEFKIDLRLRGVTTSSRMLLDDRAIPFGECRERLERRGTEADLERFAAHIQTDSIPHCLLVDCTADREIAMRYGEWLERGIHVITPNKMANTADLDYYRRLRASSRSMKMHYLYETTVGAGLPVIQTLRDLIQTGDEILQIEGILSGTLSYLFNSFDGRRPFSEIVRDARGKGYTEPDPREDLSGMDVARKVVILAREMGLEIELADLEIESLVPVDLQSGSVDDFLDRLRGFDDRMNEMVEAARDQHEVLRFVGVVDPSGRSSVHLRRYPLSHPFARIHLTDNIVQFRTRRYHENPLVVQGPGAGTEVTAGGIFADILRLATYLGATL